MENNNAVPEKENPIVNEEQINQAESTQKSESQEEIREETPEESTPEIVNQKDKPEEVGESEEPTTAEEPVKAEKSSEEGEEEEDDEEHDDESPEPNIEFDKLNKEELVELLEETVKNPEIPAIKKTVGLIKSHFLQLVKQEKAEVSEPEQEAEEGTEETEETPKAEVTDPLVERYNIAFSVYKQNKTNFTRDLEETKKQNLETKKQILEELRELINSEESLKTTYDQFSELQDKWKEVGMVPQSEINNLWQSYHFLVEKFFDKVKINKELRDLDLKKNLEQKMELCEKAEELLLETSIIKSFRELQKLHTNWKEIGPVPAEKKDEIWERFKSATEKINKRRREHYSELHEQQKNNLEAKTALCEKAEEILAIEMGGMKDWQEQTTQMQELLKVWKTIGPAPKKHNDEIWDRFRASMNTFFKNKKEYLNEIKEQQLNNYNIKLNLCVQAEAIKESTDWKKTTNELINLQKEWKKVGPVPKKYSDVVWKRFRAACDEFFNAKSEYFANIKDHESTNLDKKKEVILKVKECEFGENKSDNLNQIKEFQREWMEIGHVPIKEKDKIQAEFRKAIDSKLEKLNISEVEIDTLNYKARIDNMKDDGEIRNMARKERNFLNNRISKLRDDINVWENNIGFLANSKNADLFKAEFEKKIEKAKRDLKIYEAKMKVLNQTLSQ